MDMDIGYRRLARAIVASATKDAVLSKDSPDRVSARRFLGDDGPDGRLKLWCQIGGCNATGIAKESRRRWPG